MKREIRLVAQCYDIENGQVIEEQELLKEEVVKAKSLKDLGYLHVEQINLLSRIQDFKIKQQMLLQPAMTCPQCGAKTGKGGLFFSNFHAVLTDHKVAVQRMRCSHCKWSSATSVEGLYGSAIHPDLLEKQVVQGAKESYAKASRSLDADSGTQRPVNSHSQIHRSVKLVSESLQGIRGSEDYSRGIKPAQCLIGNLDGGHVKARGDGRSFEAMIATVHRPESLKYVNSNHNSITSKTVVASALEDNQKTIKGLFLSACKAQGMTEKTEMICLADGADNCRSIAYSLAGKCHKLTYILDWFHISMKFKNIAIADEHKGLYDKVKWHLWHGKPETALLRLEQLLLVIKDHSTLCKLNKLKTYISNNKEGIVDYNFRKRSGLVYTSQLAETTVNTVINARQKGKQKMLWSREGAHDVLQIRTSIYSNTWKKDWEKVEQELYPLAA